MNTLTARQQEILDFVAKSISSFGFPPTIPEIQKEFSFKSPTAANDHLEALARKGYIARHRGKSRGIEICNRRCNILRSDVTSGLRKGKAQVNDVKSIYEYPAGQCGIGNNLNNSDVVEIPVVGRIAAGAPLLAQENIEDTIFVDRAFVKITNGEMRGVFALRIKGDSMKDAGIYDGDLVIMEKRAQVENGEIAAVLLDDEATLKRVFREKGRIRLQPENDAMKPIFVSPGEKNISIIGKLKTVIRNIQ
jgi:repressor LexA